VVLEVTGRLSDAVQDLDWAIQLALAEGPRGVAHHMGGQLIVTASVFSAVSMVLVTPTPVVAKLRLAPHPTAPRASRDFVTRTLLDWGLDRLVLAANLVVSELVTNSTMHATTDIEVSISWNLRALRLAVRDNSPDLARQTYTRWNLNGSRLTAVADLSRGFGFLPIADEGKVAWAVLNAAQKQPLTSRRLDSATAPPQHPEFTDAGPAETSPCTV